jgi:hypothetical protein
MWPGKPAVTHLSKEEAFPIWPGSALLTFPCGGRMLDGLMRSASVAASKAIKQSLPGKHLRLPGRRVIGPLLLYLLIALGLLYPYRTNALRPTGDMRVVMSLTLQADHALREGQFPIRIGPEVLGGMDFPAFQFYGNLPYTVTGALSILLHNPYTAWKIVCLASLVCAGYFMMRLGRWLSGSTRAGVLAGAAFMCAPYLMADLNARGAFAELVAFCLLPAAFYATVRCLDANRRWFSSPSPGTPGEASGIGDCPRAGRGGGDSRKNPLPNPPPEYRGRELNAGRLKGHAVRRVLWCALAWAAIGLTHNITYLYGVLFTGLFCLPFLFSRRGNWRLLPLVLAGVIHAAMMVWYVLPQLRLINVLDIAAQSFDPFTLSPLTRLPILLAPVLTTTLESISTPNLGLQVGWPILAGVLLALLALAMRRRTPAPRRLVIALFLGGFAIAFFMVWSPFDFWKNLPKTFWFVQFPYRMLIFVTLFGSGLLACGLARWFPRRLPTWVMLVGLAGIGLAASTYVPRGQAQWTDFVPWLYQHPQVDEMAEYLVQARTLAATNVSDADPSNIDWNVRLAQIASHPGNAPIPHVGVPKSEVRYGAQARIGYFAPGPIWLEMPVFYYPGLLDVRDNGRRIEYHNSGRFVAVQLEPGRHQITLSFVGVRWANYISLVAWICVLAGLLVPVVRRLPERIRAARKTGTAIASVPFPPWEALAGFAALLVCAAIPNYAPLWQWLNPQPSVRIMASPSKAPPENAFDDDPKTAWVAAGSNPATLVVELDRPVTLHGFVLEPQVTRMNECWQHVSVRLLNGGQAMYSGAFEFPNAAKDPQEKIAFQPVAVDRIEMWFSDPVLTLPNGAHVPADQVNPGYREIRILWGE